MNSRSIWILTFIGIIVPLFMLSCQRNKGIAAPDTPVYTIADFEQVLDLRRWAIAGIAELSREKVKNGSSALKVKFFQEEWPGIATTSMPEDISHYRILKFEVYSTSKSRLNLWVRIDDLTSINSTDFKNRYNSLTELHEGWNTIEIPLKDMKSSDGKREVDLRKIEKFAIFLARPDRDVILYFDNIRLEK
ncbi:MAG: glycan-binding surface protein [Vulcanimicrobiota bacterium]